MFPTGEAWRRDDSRQVEDSDTFRGCSSVGRAPALQAGCRRFDPVQLHRFSTQVETFFDKFIRRVEFNFC